MTTRLLFPARSMGMPVPDEDSCTWGMLVHLSTLSAVVVLLGNYIAPVVIWMIKRKQHPFVADQAKTCLSFQITGSIVVLLLALLMCMGFGYSIFPIVRIVFPLVWLVFTIIAAIQAPRGVAYRHPLAIPIFR